MTAFPITQFSVFSLLGDKNYTLNVGGGASIIVGPNGAGKSNFLSILYLVLSRQWAKLADFKFDSIYLRANDSDIRVSKDDILEVMSFVGDSPRFRSFYLHLVETNKIGSFIASDVVSYADQKQYSDMFRIPTGSVKTFHASLKAELKDAKGLLALESFIESLNLGLVIYMPTYRRIEKDLRAFIPDTDTIPRRPPVEKSPRSGSWIEVIGAGMGDVKKLIDLKIQSIAIAKQRTTERAAQEYILDLVRGSISTFSLNRLKDIDEQSLISFIDSLDNSVFSQNERKQLKNKILSLRNRTKGQPKAEDRYLGLYVEKLVQAQERISALEEPLKRLSVLANKYIGVDKKFNFIASSRFTSVHRDQEEVELDGLSSGEKQVIAMFAYLILSVDSNCVLVVDEPELSLSVPWQKTLLPDILATDKCAHVFAVTHSPFIFANNLRECLIDTESMSAD
ncbi:AAA family ATPase [Rhizobium sp. Root482]|uniref:AAA family ATPase n=1 Tax=Rhizobium sp. Root482 TaxID=1736543 RepID=UPI0007246F73|nr:AAA family ATPase [Rhizobium sp. Root482]KQY13683.1 hypothetical protein ASD31_10800 [Rhizobium sp. Root482]